MARLPELRLSWSDGQRRRAEVEAALDRSGRARTCA
jgi:hypothetical protein